MYSSKFCVDTIHLAVLFKILETCPSSSHVKHLLEGMQQNKHHVVCIVSKDVVQHFNKNAELETIFRVSSICKLNHAQCNLLKYIPKVVALPYSQMSRVLIDISGACNKYPLATGFHP